MSASIFISFASQDRKVANTLCQALEGRGFKCWISSRDILPGENFQVAIVRAIRKAKLMLLVFTANSNNSAEMNKELALASQQKLTVVPLRIEDVAPNDAFAYEFATRQWIDFFADWELAMNALASQIANVLGPEDLVEAEAPAVAARTAAAPVLTPVAPEPEHPAPPELAPAEPVPPPAAESPAPPPEPASEPAAVHEPEPPAVVEPTLPAPVAEAPKPAAPPPATRPAEPARPIASANVAAPVKKKGSPLPLILGVVVVLAAAAAAAYFAMGSKSAAPKPAAGSAATPAVSSTAPTVTLAPAPASPAASSAASQPGAVSAVAPGEGDSAATAASAAPERRKHQPKTTGAGAPSRASRSDVPY